MENPDCLILAAGYGSRLEPLTNIIPKPLLPFGNGVAIDYIIQIIRKLKFRINIVVGYKSELIIEYLQNKYNDLNFIQINNPSTNILESIALSENIIQSDSFLWVGSALFFKRKQNFDLLIKEHESKKSFCTLFYQDKFRFKPKLLFESNSLSKFIVGEDDSTFSSPTIFYTSKQFIDYVKEFAETEAFQRAIDDENSFNAIKLIGDSIEIHTNKDYYLASKMIFPTGYIDKNTYVKHTKIKNSYIYSSRVENSQVSGSIIIKSDIKNRLISNKIIFMNYEQEI